MTMLDFEVEVEPLWFTDLVSADRCRDCRLPIAGRHTRCHEGCKGKGMFYVLCDTCSEDGRT